MKMGSGGPKYYINVICNVAFYTEGNIGWNMLMFRASVCSRQTATCMSHCETDQISFSTLKSAPYVYKFIGLV